MKRMIDSYLSRRIEKLVTECTRKKSSRGLSNSGNFLDMNPQDLRPWNDLSVLVWNFFFSPCHPFLMSGVRDILKGSLRTLNNGFQKTCDCLSC